MSKEDFIKLLPFFIFYTFLTWFVSDNIFFWDTVQLASLHAHYFYENNFNNLLLPNEIDSGHIPSFGMYIALIWKIFGKTLFASHFAILPFLYGIIWQAYLLIKKFINKKYVFLALVIFLADATLLAQSTLISPDVVLVFLFLLALNSVLKQNKILLSISVAGLFLISMRGMMVATSILTLDIIFNIQFTNFKETFVQLLKKTIIYIPALIIFIAFNYYHYYVKGWFAYHNNSPWATNFEITNLKGFLRNIIILIWRLIDFGRIFMWIITLSIIISSYKSIKNDKKIRKLIIILFVVSFFLLISFLMYKSLTGHRYILPIYLTFSLLTTYLIFEKIKTKKRKIIISTLLVLGLLSGNFWVYPEKIAQGWDSSLAYLNYFKLRNKTIDY
ncbi:MAG: hypothetical protein GXO49_01825, partial [Chlorobi bacterium]|nr:hypothetical protein [Chlorobiota bacterium]